LEGTLQIISFQLPCRGQGPFPPDQVAQIIELLRLEKTSKIVKSNLALNTARDWAATASLGNLGQGLTSLRVKNFYLISNLNLFFLSLKPLPLVLSLHALHQSVSHQWWGTGSWRLPTAV